MFDSANAVPANMVRTPMTAPPVIFPVLLMAILLTEREAQIGPETYQSPDRTIYFETPDNVPGHGIRIGERPRRQRAPPRVERRRSGGARPADAHRLRRAAPPGATLPPA